MSFIFLRAASGIVAIASVFVLAALPQPTCALTLQCQYVEDSPSATSSSLPAQLVPVQLSEIYPAPVSGQEEFIELYNPNDSSVDLSGFALVDASGKKFVVPADDASIAPAKSYVSFGFEQTKIFLNNSGDTVSLLDSGGATLEQVVYGNALSGQSWSRSSAGVGGTAQWQWTTIPTRNAGNIVFAEAPANEEDPDATGDALSNSNGEPKPTPSTVTAPESAPQTATQTNPHLRINELYPDPTGTDTNNEWIEIMNTSSTATNVQGWVVTDGSTRYTLQSQTLAASGGLLLLPSSQTKVSLNNGGETIQFIDPMGSVIDSVTYPKAKEGHTWAKIGGEFVWSALPTPGIANVLAGDAGTGGNDEEEHAVVAARNEGVVRTASATANSDAASKPISVAASKALENGAEISVEGAVTSLPGQLSSQIMTVQDDTGGVQIYSYKKQFPAGVVLGARVRVSGELTESRGNKRIKISQASDIEVLGGGAAPVAAREVDALDETVDGMLVRTASAIAEKSGTSWELENGVVLNIKSGTGIQGKLFKAGTELDATGIVEVSGDAYRVVPRTSNDVVLAGAASAAEGGEDGDANSAASGAEVGDTAAGVGAGTKDGKVQSTTAAVAAGLRAAKESSGRTALIILLLCIVCGVVAASIFKDRIAAWLHASKHPLAQRLAELSLVQKVFPPLQLPILPTSVVGAAQTTRRWVVADASRAESAANIPDPTRFATTEAEMQEKASSDNDEPLPFLPLKKRLKQSQLDPSL